MTHLIFLYVYKIHCIDISQLRKEFESKISHLPYVGYHTIEIFWWSYNLISHEVRENRYAIDFLIDQRRCDIFAVLTAALTIFGESKKISNFAVKDSHSTKNENLVYFQLEFEEVIEGDENSKRYILLL